MDPYEASKTVFSRIQSLDPENASKIMGLLLIQDHGEKEMIRLAFGPENLLHSVVVKARQELGLSPNTPFTPTPSSPSTFNNNNNSSSLSRQNSSTAASRFLPKEINIPTSLTLPSFVSPSSASSASWGASVFSDDMMSPSSPGNGGVSSNRGSKSTLNPSTPPFYSGRSSGRAKGWGGGELMDEIQLQEQLSFLNDNSHTLPSKSSNRFYSQSELLGSGVGDSMLFNGDANTTDWGGGQVGGLPHRRCVSVSDINMGSLLDDPASGVGGWKPCLYYARGFCKNGSSCRFVHGGLSESEAAALAGSPTSKLEMMEQCHELLRSKSMQHHKLMAAMASVSGSGPGSPNFPYSMSKGLSLFAQHQQNDIPRAAAAAAAALMMGEDFHKLSRSPRRLDNCWGDSNPAASRQIYLTFPADSTFREEDVSNYFSNYGPVQDVRIPYQQKRMFGFVTFVYPDTVKIILAKGNPHFVCDARVLVKPYKEKGKVPDKFRKQQHQMDRGEFSSCNSPTGVDSRDPFDLPAEARMMYDTQTQYMLWRRKLEEQTDLQQALEMQSQRLMGLQLLDVKRNHHHRSLSTGAQTIHSPTQSPNSIFHQTLLGSDRSSPDASDEICASPPLNEAINETTDKDKEISVGGVDNNYNCNEIESPCHEDNVFHLPESLEHILPDSPFASPKKRAAVSSGTTGASISEGAATTTLNSNSKVSPFIPTSPALDMGAFKSCYFEMPRFSPGHGAIGM